MTIVSPNESLEFLARYSADIAEPCPVVHCRARRGEPCHAVPAGKVHQSRRVARLQRESRPATPRDFMR
jgi:hypothetical protein